MKKSVDPVTKKDVFIAPDGYDATKEDDKHDCNDTKPSASISGYSGGTLRFNVNQGTFGISTIDIKVDGVSVGSVGAGANTATIQVRNGQKVTLTVTDSGFYTADSNTYTVSGGSE